MKTQHMPNKKTYIIIGPDSPKREARLFWKQKKDQPVIAIGKWILDIKKATEYDRSILGPTPLPTGTTSIISFDTESDSMDQYTLDSLPELSYPI
jgi:hypothetical protein